MASPAGTFEHILVLIERGAVPFCHYENPHFHGAGEPRWIEEKVLRDIVAHAAKTQTSVTVLLGRNRPPAGHEKILDRIAHMKIVPAELSERYPGGVLTLFSQDAAAFGDLTRSGSRTVILRVARSDLARLEEMFASLSGAYARLSICLTDIESFTQSDIDIYADELEGISRRLKKMFVAGRRIEVDVLTDRMMLRRMRNCDAGVKHITVAADGNCYVCPAFAGEENTSLGAFGKAIPAEQLSGLDLEHAPLCSRCDAYHCRRCVWLNRKLTLERNVPSQQQCLLAHAEREASRLLLRELDGLEPFRRLPLIPEIRYRDPLELIDLPLPGLTGTGQDDPML